MSVCHKCNDEGLEGGCPRCGLTPRKASGLKVLHLDIPTEIIPQQYQGLMWDKPAGDDLPMTYRQVDDAMEKIYNKFLSGVLPAYSVFLSAPPKMGKAQFAYACMQTALAQRFSVAPYFSTGDWRRLHKVSQMNPMYKLYNRYRWDGLVSMDVVFLYIDYSEERYTDIPLLKSILDTRASLGKPTFIVSDYKLESLVPRWDSDLFMMIYNPDPKRDFKRYPVLLQRF